MEPAAGGGLDGATAYWLAALLGACLGSFANVLIFRLPRDLSIVGPRSFCPVCRVQVPWYDNLPVVSWLLLRGRCRACGAGIPVRYLLIELAGAGCGLLAAWRFGPSLTGVVALLFLIDLLAIAWIDWQHMIIPHTLTVSGLVIALAASPWSGPGPVQALLGAGAGAGVILALSHGYRLVRGQPGMGGGDVMLMGMVGAFLGPVGVVMVLCLGALLGTLFALVRFRGALAGQAKLPFGTFLAVAAVASLLAGDLVVQWYLGLLA